MIPAQEARRRQAILAWILVTWLLPLIVVMLLPTLAARDPSAAPPMLVVESAAVTWLMLSLFFWFKAHYHWALAKGRSPNLMWLGLLGFPLAPIVFGCLHDRVPGPPPLPRRLRKGPVPPPEPDLACPACGASYRLSHYDLSAPAILCSICKEELPKG